MPTIVSAPVSAPSLPWIVVGVWLILAAAGLGYFQLRLPPSYAGAAWCGAAARTVPPSGRPTP